MAKKINNQEKIKEVENIKIEIVETDNIVPFSQEKDNKNYSPISVLNSLKNSLESLNLFYLNSSMILYNLSQSLDEINDFYFSDLSKTEFEESIDVLKLNLNLSVEDAENIEAILIFEKEILDSIEKLNNSIKKIDNIKQKLKENLKFKIEPNDKLEFMISDINIIIKEIEIFYNNTKTSKDELKEKNMAKIFEELKEKVKEYLKELSKELNKIKDLSSEFSNLKLKINTLSNYISTIKYEIDILQHETIKLSNITIVLSYIISQNKKQQKGILGILYQVKNITTLISNYIDTLNNEMSIIDVNLREIISQIHIVDANINLFLPLKNGIINYIEERLLEV